MAKLKGETSTTAPRTSAPKGERGSREEDSDAPNPPVVQQSGTDCSVQTVLVGVGREPKVGFDPNPLGRRSASGHMPSKYRYFGLPAVTGPTAPRIDARHYLNHQTISTLAWCNGVSRLRATCECVKSTKRFL